MQVLASQSKPRPLTHRTAKALQTTAAVAEDEQPLASPAYCSCGWFDSSYELNTGLQVTEEQDPSLLQLWARVLNGTMARH